MEDIFQGVIVEGKVEVGMVEGNFEGVARLEPLVSGFATQSAPQNLEDFYLIAIMLLK